MGLDVAYDKGSKLHFDLKKIVLKKAILFKEQNAPYKITIKLSEVNFTKALDFLEHAKQNNQRIEDT